jgi:undecaprenyl-diphosphatase
MIDFLIQIDTSLFTFINSHHNTFFDAFFLVICQLGSGWIAVPLVAVVIIMATPRSFLAKVLLCAAIAGILAGIANTQIKIAVHRPRPVNYFEQGLSPGGASPVIESTAYRVHCVGKILREHSFPSGHAATAFAAAAIVALLFGGYYYLGFIPALLVAYSRMYMGVHFPSDVLGGAVLGSAAALLVIVFFRQKKYLPGPVTLRRNHA